MTLPNSRFGFTLVELMVIISIVAVLSVVGVSRLTGVSKNADDTKKRAEVDLIAKAYEANYDPTTGRYQALSASDFSTAIDQSKYSGLVTTPVSIFKVCSTLGDGSQYCKESSLGKRPTSTPTPTATPTSAPTPTLAPVICPAGLMAYWKMNEVDGNSVSDSIGSWIGTATNTTISPGFINNSRTFNNGGYISLPARMARFTSGSISLWVSSTVANLTGDQGLYDNATSNGTVFHISRSNNKVSFARLRSGSWQSLTSADLTWNSGVWHNVVVTWTSSSMKLFIDGVFSASNTQNGQTDLGPLSNTWLGRLNQAGYYFNGSLDEVGTWANKALTATEVSLIYSQGRGCIP